MQVEAFKVFRDLVDSRSFSKAARSNFITQSAVSQQIRSLEQRFGFPFIDRRHKHFSLTREGQLFYQTAKKIVVEFEALQHRIAAVRNVVGGAIRVSTVYSIGLHELPPYLKRFLKEFPSVHVHVEYRRSNQVYDDVAEGASDLGLVAYPAPRQRIRIELFRRDRLVVICHPKHPLAGRGAVTVKAVAAEKFIGFEPDIPTRKAVDRIFLEYGLEVTPVMEFDNIETVKRAVEIDAGISIVPRSTLAQEVASRALVALEFKGREFHRPLGILYKGGRVHSPAMRRFLETLKEEIVPPKTGRRRSRRA